MRIIGGTFKGRKFTAPKRIPARPTTDFAKESLFNILENRVDLHEVNMLDLFAGIGSISLEALSRGVPHLMVVDRNRHSVVWLKQVLEELKLENAQVIKADALKWLETLEDSDYQLVFADPPYDFEEYPSLIDKVLSNVLVNGGLFILEHRKSGSFAEHANFAEERTYGEVKFTFFEI